MSDRSLSISNFLEPDDPNLAYNLFGHRGDFPEPAENPEKPNIMSSVTKLIKEGSLTKFISAGQFPAVMSEPFTEHHRRAQMAEYFGVLDKAAEEPKGSAERLLYVTAFTLASWAEARSHQMHFKPTKPLARETYELVMPKEGYKFLAEDVFQDKSKGVFISVWKAWGKQWGLDIQNDPVLKFSFSSSGPCLLYDSRMPMEFVFKDGDRYSAVLPPGMVSHLTSSPQVWSFTGSAIVTNTTSNMACDVDLSEPGFLSREGKHRVKGHLLVNGKIDKSWKFHGHWDKQLLASRTGKKTDQKELILWETTPGPRNRFGFNSFAVQLNSLPAELQKILPPTDSRFREDLQAVERGEYSKAEDYRRRLAEWQSKQTEKHEPLWFEPGAPSSNSQLTYRYKGGYWEARAAKLQGKSDVWSMCPQIFGPPLQLTQ